MDLLKFVIIINKLKTMALKGILQVLGALVVVVVVPPRRIGGAGGRGSRKRACANSKIFIFRFGEGEHENRLQNICSPTQRGASRHDGPRPDGRGPSCRIVSRCVGVNILESILVCTLSVNAKYKYFAICGCFRVPGCLHVLLSCDLLCFLF